MSPQRQRALLSKDQRGLAFVEFLVAFIPIWIFFLSIVQLSLISTARLIVRHAADSAARAAVVVLPDDPKQYEGRADKLEAIRMAALAPLTPLAPAGLGTRPTIAKATNPASPASAIYSAAALSVSFPGQADGSSQGPELTVRVRYAYACQVPIARSILCSGLFGLGTRRQLGKKFRSFANRFPGSRFLRLEHETTLLMHDAPYDYEPPGGRS